MEKLLCPSLLNLSMDYLKDDLPKLTLEQAKFKQSLGLNEWDPMPEGVEYPESIR